jgi:hypothetical protein
MKSCSPIAALFPSRHCCNAWQRESAGHGECRAQVCYLQAFWQSCSICLFYCQPIFFIWLSRAGDVCYFVCSDIENTQSTYVAVHRVFHAAGALAVYYTIADFKRFL